MAVIMDYSLAQKYASVDDEGPPYYTIHDIILDYLKGSIPPQKQVGDVHYDILKQLSPSLLWNPSEITFGREVVLISECKF